MGGMSKNTSHVREETGWSRRIRERLRLAREAQDLTLEDVADRVAARLGVESWSPGSISHYELFRRHPKIDVMAAWARAVGLRLIVDLDTADGERVPVLLSRRTAPIARALEAADPKDFETIRLMVERIIGLEPDV